MSVRMGVPSNEASPPGADLGPARGARPHDGNMFNPTMCHEIRDCLELVRCETRREWLL